MYGVKMLLRVTSGIMMIICGMGVLVLGAGVFIPPMRDYMIGALLVLAGTIIIQDAYHD